MVCCEILWINGVKTHEHGCTEAYKDRKYICKWCFREFQPEQAQEKYCSTDCYLDYNNLPNGD